LSIQEVKRKREGTQEEKKKEEATRSPDFRGNKEKGLRRKEEGTLFCLVCDIPSTKKKCVSDPCAFWGKPVP